MEFFAFSEVDSTNQRALDLWRQRRGALVVTAGRQTQGVGRSGRRWHSPAGGLWMTIAWPFGATAEALPLVIGLAARDAIAAETGLEAQIKWPNDVLVAGKKVAGVLCRAEVGAAADSVLLIGVGINANFSVVELAGDLRQPATTLRDETGGAVDLTRLTRRLAAEIEAALRALERGEIGIVLQRVRAHLAWMGEPVTCSGTEGENPAAGIFRGIDDLGAALVEFDGECRSVTMGELHFSRAEKRSEAAVDPF